MKKTAKQWFLKSTTVAVLCVFTIQAQAMSMKEVFDAVNAQGNVTSPGVLQGQTMNLGTGGSLYMRMPKRTYNLVSVTPPSLSAGCGGIDLFMGGFSFINKDQFVAMMRNIGSNALGYAFELALSNISPDAKNIIQALRATANAANKNNIDSCTAAKGIVNASLSDSFDLSAANAAKMLGVDSNTYSDVTGAWSEVADNWGKQKTAIAAGEAKDPANKNLVATGNVVWKSLKKLSTLNDVQRQIIMSMVGTVVVDKDAPVEGRVPTIKPPLDIDIKALIQPGLASAGADFEVYKCDTLDEDGCVGMSLGNVKDFGTYETYTELVSKLLSGMKWPSF
jgi:conjugative transfer pilus assembly protein TraH